MPASARHRSRFRTKDYFCRPLRGREIIINAPYPAMNRWAIIDRPLRGLYLIFACHRSFLHSLNNRARRNACYERQTDDASARAFDFFATMNLIQSVVASLDQNIRQQFGDQ